MSITGTEDICALCADLRTGRFCSPLRVWRLAIWCCGGAFFAASVDTAALLAQPGMVSSDVSAAELISILCGYGAYGFGCLILSTTYVGFLLMPLVLAVKGFLSGCVFAAYLRAAAPHAFARAAIEICLPGVFLLPALLLLGALCMQLSYRLLCHYRGTTPSGPPENHSRTLSVVLILMLLAAALESYAVPYLTQWMLAS